MRASPAASAAVHSMLFYTGKGDKGTSRVGGKKIPKDSVILETLGELDELNSLMGLAKSALKNKKLSEKLQNAQENLFIIQAQVACIMIPKFKPPVIAKEKILALEREIATIETRLKPERGFIIPGDNLISSWLDYLRAVSRRVERKAYILHKKHPLPDEILVYLNRLSSYLYALAREGVPKGKREAKPKYK